MKENYKNEVRYYTFPAFEEHPEIVHAFTSRECGVSGGYYSSLNMGIHTGDDLENVKTNYRILCQTLSLDPEKIVLANLVHGDTIRNVTAADAGAGLWRDFPYEGVDGLLTNETGLILTATFADCIPSPARTPCAWSCRTRMPCRAVATDSPPSSARRACSSLTRFPGHARPEATENGGTRQATRSRRSGATFRREGCRATHEQAPVP